MSKKQNKPPQARRDYKAPAVTSQPLPKVTPPPAPVDDVELADRVVDDVEKSVTERENAANTDSTRPTPPAETMTTEGTMREWTEAERNKYDEEQGLRPPQAYFDMSAAMHKAGEMAMQRKHADEIAALHALAQSLSKRIEVLKLHGRQQLPASVEALRGNTFSRMPGAR